MLTVAVCPAQNSVLNFKILIWYNLPAVFNINGWLLKTQKHNDHVTWLPLSTEWNQTCETKTFQPLTAVIPAQLGVKLIPNISNIVCTWNQSIVQQLIREGNMRRRFRKASPIGLKARTTWRLLRTLSRNLLYMFSGVSSACGFSFCSKTCICKNNFN